MNVLNPLIETNSEEKWTRQYLFTELIKSERAKSEVETVHDSQLLNLPTQKNVRFWLNVQFMYLLIISWGLKAFTGELIRLDSVTCGFYDSNYMSKNLAVLNFSSTAVRIKMETKVEKKGIKMERSIEGNEMGCEKTAGDFC